MTTPSHSDGAGDPVAAAAHRDRQAGVTREAQRLGDLGGVLGRAIAAGRISIIELKIVRAVS